MRKLIAVLATITLALFLVPTLAAQIRTRTIYPADTWSSPNLASAKACEHLDKGTEVEITEYLEAFQTFKIASTEERYIRENAVEINADGQA